MENLQKETESKIPIEEYNDIPVHYCTKCGSLRIIIFDNDTDYCDECGSTDIAEAHIEEVLEIKKQKK